MTEMQKYIEFTDTTATASFDPDPWGDVGDIGNNPVIHGMIGVANEAGELLGLYNKAAFNNKQVTRDQIADELGDVLWYMGRILRGLGMSFEELAARNTAKLTARFTELHASTEARKTAEMRAQISVSSRESLDKSSDVLDIHAFNGA
jgi:NTP pyrophosphatase (non-canonical NTP hydrolase)